MISAGLPTRWMTLAIVNVLPVPVAPSSVWWRRAPVIPATSASIAAGWSPVGVMSVTSLKLEPPLTAPL